MQVEVASVSSWLCVTFIHSSYDLQTNLYKHTVNVVLPRCCHYNTYTTTVLIAPAKLLQPPSSSRSQYILFSHIYSSWVTLSKKRTCPSTVTGSSSCLKKNKRDLIGMRSFTAESIRMLFLKSSEYITWKLLQKKPNRQKAKYCFGRWDIRVKRVEPARPQSSAAAIWTNGWELPQSSK